MKGLMPCCAIENVLVC